MSNQTQANPQTQPEAEDEHVVAKDLHNEKLSDDIDAILDDIDDVLEENAEEFVSSYVQKGGQ